MIALLPALVLLAAVRCGTVTAVSPLHRGESALAASPGGPVANVGGMNIPMPYAVARCRYGRIGENWGQSPITERWQGAAGRASG